MGIEYILIVIGVVFVSMTLHELMHGLVSTWLGDNTANDSGRLTLNPFKHIDPFMTVLLPLTIVLTNIATGSSMPIFGGAKPVPFNPHKVKHGEWGVALVAISGPLVNLVLAFVFYALLAFLSPSSGSLMGQMLTTATLVNLGFFAFNIIPIPPLDGSRVLYALAPDFVRNAFDAIERYGVVLVFVVVMVASPLVMQYMSYIISFLLRLFSVVVGG